MPDLHLDLRHAARRLRRAPGFTAIVVLTLALGIGANSAVFTLARAVVLEPLPYAAPERLVMVWRPDEPGGTTWLSAQEVTSLQDRLTTTTSVAGWTELAANLTGGDAPERVVAAAVTPELFGTLGVRPAAGRLITGADAANADGVVVLAHGLWQRRFGGRAGVVGQTIQVSGRARTVVGVLPPAFRLPLDYRAERPTEVYVPLVFDRDDLGEWGSRNYVAVARLAAGATASTASAELAVVAEQWIQAGYVERSSSGIEGRRAIPVTDLVTGGARGRVALLLGAVVLVLVTACANLVNLVLARSDAGAHESAVRAALGASRGVLSRERLGEALLLAVGGGAAGLAVAYGGLAAVKALRPDGLPRLEDASIDAGVVGVTAVLALATGIVVGLLPALRARRLAVGAVMADTWRGGSASRGATRARGALVVVQVALSVVLVIGAGLLVRSLLELTRIDLGFDDRSALTARIDLPAASYPEPAAVASFYARLDRRLQAIPGVRAAGGARILPLTDTIGDWSITLDSRPYDRAENPNADLQIVTPGYMRAMGLRLRRGRPLLDTDDGTAPLVAVVSETMAARYWPGDEAVGHRFHLGTLDQPWVTIVGVVAGVRHNAVVEEGRAEMYLPHVQMLRENRSTSRGMSLVLATDGDPRAFVGALRQAVADLDPTLPVSDIRPLAQVTSRALAAPRFTAWLLVAFGALALVLAAVGIYGTLSLIVTERSREIGIRLALGAEPRTIVGLVLSRGMALAGAGVAAGIAGGAALSSLASNLVYGVSPLDPATFAAAPAVLVLAAAAACALPARRAARVDPVETLRRA